MNTIAKDLLTRFDAATRRLMDQLSPLTEDEPFTRHKWLGFNTIHTERHNHQLETMIRHL